MEQSPMTLEALGMDARTETKRDEDLFGERGNMAARLSCSQEKLQYLSAKERWRDGEMMFVMGYGGGEREY